jgi:hypothetical protein
MCLASFAWGCSVYDASVPAGDTSTGAGSGGSAATSGAAGLGGTAGDGVGTGAAGETGAGGDSGSGGGTAGGTTGSGGQSDDAGPNDPDATCTPEDDMAFCQRLGKNCGSVTRPDNCGVARTVTCGTCMPLGTCGGGGITNSCGSGLNLAQGGTVTATNPGIAPDDMTKAFDNDAATKWFVGGVSTPSITYAFAGSTSHRVTTYAVTSAGDMPERDPYSWQLQGSNSASWTTIDTRTGEVFANRLQTNLYSCGNGTAYRRYRFLVMANHGGADFQVAEIQLFGN